MIDASTKNIYSEKFKIFLELHLLNLATWFLSLKFIHRYKEISQKRE